MLVLHFAPCTCINSFIKVKLFHLWTFYMNLPIIGQSTRSRPKHCRFWTVCGRHGAAPCGQHGAAADAADTALSRSRRADTYTQPIQRCRHAADTALPTRGRYSAAANSRCAADTAQLQAADTQPTQHVQIVVLSLSNVALRHTNTL